MLMPNSLKQGAITPSTSLVGRVVRNDEMPVEVSWLGV